MAPSLTKGKEEEEEEEGGMSQVVKRMVCRD